MEQEEILETFEYSEMENGKEHFYRITTNEDHFAIEKDGCIIAELVCDSDWRQIKGKPLSKKLIHKLGEHIEGHYC